MSQNQRADPVALETLVTEVVDEFMDRLHKGEQPKIEEYASRNPTIAKLLRRLLPALQVMGPPSLSASARSGAAQLAGSAAAVPGCLGDFYILRQIGQGGMGVVYEAEQISLVRRVALKVLPFATALDAKQLQRFKTEAQAAAHLHHQNIVPVYTVGCERGIHYYAMQFIEGQSLATMIQGLRQLAGIGGQDPAQAEGPASILTKDLASGRCVPAAPASAGCPAPDLPAASPASAKVAADTPNPMAAAYATERSVNYTGFFRTVAHWGVQAAGALEHAHQLGVVHRDIKPANLLVDERGNLWITDFGLARLQGDNALTVIGDLLGTIRYMSPEQAQSGRQLVDHRTDIYSLGVTLYELLALQPAFPGTDRNELLRQITFEEPPALRRLNRNVPAELETILLKATAKNPNERYATAQELAEDFTRFLEDKPIRARRPSLLQRLKRQLRRHKGVVVSVTASAVVLLVLAVGALALSNLRIVQEQEETRKALAEAKASHQAAAMQKEHAEANLRKALAAVDQMLTEVSENHLLNRPQMEPVRRALLEKALKFYQGFLEEKGNDPNIRFETGRAYCRVGNIYLQLGQPGPSEKAHRQGLELLEKLLTDFPAMHRYRQEVASICGGLGAMLRQDFGRPCEAEPFLRRARGLWEHLVADFPTNAAYRLQLATTCHHLGYQLWSADRLPEAEQVFRQALVQWDKFAKASPQNDRWGQAQSYNSLGLVLRTRGQLSEAEQAHRTALALVRGPLFGAGRELNYRWESARSNAQLGIVLVHMDRFEEAEAAVRAALVVRAKFVADWPTSWFYALELALTYRSLGWLLEVSGRPGLAEQPYRQALAVQEKLRADFPNHPESWKHLAGCHALLGRNLHETGRVAEAEKSLRAAAKEYRQGLKKAPNNPQANHDFAWFLATCPLEQLRDTGQGLALAKKAVALAPGTAEYLATLGVAHYRQRNWQAALTTLEKSLEHPKSSATAPFFRAMTHWQMGAKERARRCYDHAVAELAKNKIRALEARRFRAEAATLLGIR